MCDGIAWPVNRTARLSVWTWWHVWTAKAGRWK